MDFTKKILPGDKLDISLTNAENDAVYKSMFSDLISEKMWEITMPVSAGRIVLLQVGEPFSFILYTSDKVLLEGSAIVRKRYKKAARKLLWLNLQCKKHTGEAFVVQKIDLNSEEDCVALCDQYLQAVKTGRP